jgi:signal transduction histidine kinase/ligand-binding sensor domain-containing protein
MISVCCSQHNRYGAQQWKVEEGLPQSTVRCIAQTVDGYIWAGTWQGLARFDGVRFVVFNTSNTPALSSANIMSLFCDSRGQLWIGTDAGGLVRYAGGAFRAFDSTEGCSASRILSINEDRSGRMWFATEIGIFSYDGIRFRHFTAANGLPYTYANQVLPFSDGAMYLGFVGAGSRVRLDHDSLIVEHSFPVGGYSIAIDRSDSLWFGVRGTGLVCRGSFAGARERVDRRFAGLKTGETYILRSGEKWLITSDDIRIIGGDQPLLRQIDNLTVSGISTVFEDHEGNIWLGKEGGGLILLRKKLVEVYSRENGFSSNLIMCGTEDSNGNVWIGTWDAGLLRSRSPKDLRFSSSVLPNDISSIYTLHPARSGGVWAGTWGKGLYSVTSAGATLVSGEILDNSTSIISVAENAKGELWIGTAHFGVVHISGNTKHIWNTASGLSGNRVNALLVAKNGDIWITLSANGVNRISGGNVTTYNKGNGLNDNFASPLYEDSDGAVWIGTNRGLTRWKNGTFSFVTEEQGLFDNAVAQIIQDNRGDFWIGAIHGIYRVSKDELNAAADGTLANVRCFTIGKEDGMLNEETAGGDGARRCWKTSDGRLWFSTSRGVVVLDPEKVSAASVPPIVLIESVWIDNEPVPLSDRIVLEPGNTKVEVRYTGINFAAPGKIRFYSLLEGQDARWNDAGTKRFIQYTNLAPGEYLFRLQGENKTGMRGLREAVMTIVVLPPYYATWWFRGIVALFFLTVGPAVYVVRVRQLTKDKERQVNFSRLLIRSQESERKRIANELHDSLGQTLLVIKNKLLVQQQQKTMESDQLGDVSELVSAALQDVRSISHNLRPHQLDQLGITKTLRSVVRQADESTAIVCTSQIQDIDGLLSPEEEICLFRIVQESFNNIIKHSGAVRASVTVVRYDHSIAVSVTDNGKGIFTSASGFGISGMHERAKMFGWKLAVIPADGGGTEVRLSIPVKSIS